MEPETRLVETNGTVLNVATAGSGPAVLLVHGWPHTWQVWSEVIPHLARDFRVIAPDLRGLGGSAREADGYDAGTIAGDLDGLLDAEGVRAAAVVAIDLGVAAAYLLAMRRHDRITRLVLMEGLLGGLPGAESRFAAGPPWWFGFHAVPGLAESVLQGRERQYVGWFLDGGTVSTPIAPSLREAFLDSYTGTEALRCGFEHYRAFPENARQIDAAVATGRLRIPAMTIGAGAVGGALHAQLSPHADDLTGHLVPDCGHIVPLDRPAELRALLAPFLRDVASARGR